MQSPDPIIDEIHAIREAIASANDDDIRKIAEAARARQQQGDAEVVSLPPRLIVDKQAS